MPDDEDASAGAAGNPFEPGRLFALSDGVIAIALTLLVLDLSLPDGLNHADEVNTELVNLLPNLLAFLITFAVIGRYWMAHRSICAGLDKVDVPFLWLNLAFLLPIALMPFTAKALANYGDFALPTIIYAADIALCGVLAFGLAEYAARRLDRAPRDGSPLAGLSVVAVFTLSIPVALFSPELAKCVWILIPLVSYLTGRYDTSRRATTAA